MDKWAAANPNPGWRPFQRLTRAEYAQSVKDLLDVDVDVTAYLPPDTMSQGFDNIADTQSFSPALPQGYLRAASQISRLAVGDRAASPTTATYRVLATENQMQYVEGTPFGSRGGAAFVHTFPADGLYKFHATLVRTVSGELFGNTAVHMAGRNELLEISVNGDRVAVLEVEKGMNDAGEKGLTLETAPIADQGGSAASCRRLRSAVRRAGGRPARADRSDAHRHAHRHGLRRDDGAAPAGAGGRRTR